MNIDDLTKKQKIYWKKREKFDELFPQYEKKQLRKNAIIYDTVIKDATKNIKAFYGEYAKDGIITNTEAVTPITNRAKIVKEIEREIGRVKGDIQYTITLGNLKNQKNIQSVL